MRAALTTTVITPNLPVFLAGYGDRHEPANAVHDDLEARALLVESDSQRCCLVTCDLLAMTPDFSTPIRQAVAERIETPIERVLTACTHVHAGPSTLSGTDAIGWPVPSGYREVLVDRIAAAAGDAVAELESVVPSFAGGALPHDVAINRRGHPLAPRAQVFILDPVVTIANFGIHPTVTGPSNLAIATDWVGPFRRDLDARTGRRALFLQGCQGDVNPAVTSWDDGDPSCWGPTVDTFAARLAAAIADLAADAIPLEAEPLSSRTRTMRVPIGDTLLGRLAGNRGERAVDLVEWRLGALRLTTVPGEGFHGLEQNLRATDSDPLLVAGLAPEWHGYLPVPFTHGYEEGLSLGEEAVGQLVEELCRGPR